MNPTQRELARHALGLPNKRNRSYRNHFVTGPGSDDYDQWTAMVSAGLATKRKGSELTGGDDLFRLTKEGAALACGPGEFLDPEDFPKGMTSNHFNISTAVLSDCGLYRYRLDRRWADGRIMGFIMLNPSTADATEDDPTIRRCISFANREGCGGLVVVNLYPMRATKPTDLWAKDPLERIGGPEGEVEFARAVEESDMLVAAWGADTRGADHWILHRYGSRLLCLGKTKDGHPRHPLYVRADAPLIPLQQKGGAA